MNSIVLTSSMIWKLLEYKTSYFVQAKNCSPLSIYIWIYCVNINAVLQYEGLSKSFQTEPVTKYVHTSIAGGCCPLPSLSSLSSVSASAAGDVWNLLYYRKIP